jgi:hypothetical protein
MSAAGPLNSVVSSLLGLLDDFLPPSPVGPLPNPSVQLVTFTQREVGLGQWRGTETRADLAVVALKGVRLDAIARYQLWAADANAASAAIGDLQGRLLGSREALRGLGVLDLRAHEMAGPAFEAGAPGWYATLDFRVLFEFQYQDDDGASSIIARIPVDLDPERAGSPDREHLEVTDAMVRWDELAAPELVLEAARGFPRVGHLSVLALLPALPADPADPTAWHGAPVVLALEQSGVRRQRVFATVREFVGAFSPDGSAELGGDTYVGGTLEPSAAGFPGPVTLTRPGDVLTVTYSAASFDDGAVLYLRAHP